MFLVQLARDLCCHRRSGTADERREKAMRAVLKARKALYERSRLRPSSMEDLGCNRFLSESKFCKNGAKGRTEALVTPPVTVPVLIPKDFQPGQQVRAEGPHGGVQVDAPPGAEPGSEHLLRLAPPAEFRLGVPKGAKEGSELVFQRPDGVEVCVKVPDGLRPGDTFDVPPPAVMVQVPEKMSAGETVVFRHTEASGEDEWCQVKIPDGVRPGGYFAARLPAPKATTMKSSSKDSEKGPKRRTRGGA